MKSFEISLAVERTDLETAIYAFGAHGIKPNKLNIQQEDPESEHGIVYLNTIIEADCEVAAWRTIGAIVNTFDHEEKAEYIVASVAPIEVERFNLN